VNPSIAHIRKDYILQSLDEKDTNANPIAQFTRWWEEAVNSEIDEVNAMTLCTATKAGIPSARIVLLKGYDHNGFIFFTNYNSAKGKELSENPFASLVFFWKELERQVCITGAVEKINAKESDDYFNSRPEGSKIGAWASPQSSVIEARDVIEAAYIKHIKQFTNAAIPRPQHWGGYIVKPTSVEFWQGRQSRLHDRIRYTKENDTWIKQRLAP